VFQNAFNPVRSGRTITSVDMCNRRGIAFVPFRSLVFWLVLSAREHPTLTRVAFAKWLYSSAGMPCDGNSRWLPNLLLIAGTILAAPSVRETWLTATF